MQRSLGYIYDEENLPVAKDKAIATFDFLYHITTSNESVNDPGARRFRSPKLRVPAPEDGLEFVVDHLRSDLQE